MKKTLRSILEHRNSVRKFTGEQITDKELSILLEAANAAPVAMRLHDNLKIIVIQNKKLLDKLDQNAIKMYRENKGMERSTAIFHAPTLIIIAAKKNEDRDTNHGLYCTSACMLQNMILAATEMELGNVYLMGVTVALNSNQDLKKRVGISEEYEAMSAIAIGKTDIPFIKRDLTIPRFDVQLI